MAFMQPPQTVLSAGTLFDMSSPRVNKAGLH